MDDNLKEYRESLHELLNKSHDTFEKQLSYISSGAIGASMLIVDKMFDDFSQTTSRCLLTAGWIILATTLLLNLSSHLLAGHFHYSTMKEIDCGSYDDKKAIRRNLITNVINWVCAFLLFLGVLFIVIFVSVNI